MPKFQKGEHVVSTDVPSLAVTLKASGYTEVKPAPTPVAADPVKTKPSPSK